MNSVAIIACINALDDAVGAVSWGRGNTRSESSGRRAVGESMASSASLVGKLMRSFLLPLGEGRAIAAVASAPIAAIDSARWSV